MIVIGKIYLQMPKQILFTQKIAEQKSISAGIHIQGAYLGALVKTTFECPYCKHLFIARPSHIWNKSIQSCGCYRDKISAQNGRENIVKTAATLRKAKPGNSLADKYPESLKLWDYNKNYPQTPYTVNKSAGDKYWMICNKGHSYNVLLNDFALKHCRCPYCSGHKILIGFNDLLSQKPKIAQEWHPIKNTKQPNQYTVCSQKRVWWLGQCGHEWYTSIACRKYCGCPICNESKGEKRIAEILDRLQIIYVREKRFKECKNKVSLPFDFYVPAYDLLIEYQGIQHYKEMTGIRAKKDNLINIQYRDKIKKDYAINNHQFLEIPYIDFDKIEKILYEHRISRP